MTVSRPQWWRPGLSPEEIASWEASERAAEQGYREAPVLPGSQIATDLQRMFSDLPARLREQQRGAA